MAKIISFFNHKGGVGKTTLVHNLAFALADIGQKVLIIDADPQMNLTAAMYGLSTSIDYSIEEESKWMQHRNKFISIKEYFDNEFGISEEKISKPFFSKKSKYDEKGIVELLSGDLNLTELEANLYGAIKSGNALNRKILSTFEASIRKFKNYDFILIDTPPSSSSIINALMVLCGDYFIAPTAPSFFSLQAIDNLSSIVQNWMNMVIGFQETMGNPGLNIKMKFLGIVVQMAKRFKGVSSATEKWVSDVNINTKRFHNYAITLGKSITEEEFKKIFSNEGANGHSSPFIIEKCCDFTPQLRTIAEHFGIPVIYLTQELCDQYKITTKANSRTDITTDSKENQYKNSFDSINKSYRKIAKDFLNLV